ncbi:MAG: DedA family protein [Acidimicrobiales bacterium]
MLHVLDNVLTWLDSFSGNPWFYLVIFLIATIDSFFPVVPSETTVILGGLAAGQGDLNIGLVILVGAAGAFLGDGIAYGLGRRFGPTVSRWLFRGEKGPDRLRRAGDQIRKRGGLLLITARFIPGGRTALTFSCGLTRQPYLAWFVRWDAVAALLWAAYAGSLGYYFGDRFKDDHTTAFLYAFGTALSITVLIEAVRYARHKWFGGPADDLTMIERSVGVGSESGSDGPKVGESRSEQG